MYDTKITATMLLMLTRLISCLQARIYDSSTVDPRKDGSMSTMIPFEGSVVIIRDPIDDNLI
jgi:hypothetical protein